MKYSLKNATPADKTWLENLRKECYKDLFDATWGQWDEARHQRHFLASWNKGIIQIIESEDKAVGMLQAIDVDGTIEIAEIQVSPEHQRQGLGSVVIGDIINDANKNKKTVGLSTGLKNDGALKLYKKLGFKETHRTDAKVFMKLSAEGI